ncbi:MAG: acetyl-CoA carboxylase biotin carboxylase subunit [Actinobacteria bacterium]|nr:acetyl-CoA carboxylase biotin carboxylase subunit [Actinomycetota bacterium]MCL5446110.1 acetyl-CoA carboxylase biotin carboxylase subunit [Actinomycetota bacterium]
MLGKVLVANRGEIAVRIIRTCRDMGITTVAVYSEVDRFSMHARMADEAYCIGGATAQESYLNTAAILEVLEKSGADSVHPGYGFFSENTDFARAVTGRGAIFIGPPPEAIETMGDKISSRIAARAAGVDGVPGTMEPITDPAQVIAFGNSHGWPVAIKAAYGGGGRGMKVVDSAGGVDEALESAKREALAYFGREETYMERYLAWPRHIEMQIIVDNFGNAVWMGERDCSCQRRHQKLVEESPAPDFPEEIRQAMGEAAVKVAVACGYRNAGTVEFLYQDGDFYFLEMNTRLQVEHPVTELVTGTDLVALQLKVAAGEPLGFSQEDIRSKGHAIEVRINAEDPTQGRFLPSPGTLTMFTPPGGPGVRLDSGYEAGDTVSQHYDNLIAKLIVWASDRETARIRMLRALGETKIEGVSTTIPADILILSHPDFAAAKHSTRWVESTLDLTQLGKPLDHQDSPGATPVGTASASEEALGAAPRATARDASSTQLAERDVTAEIDGRRYRVRMWMPDAYISDAGGQSTSRTPAAPRPSRRAPTSSASTPTAGTGNISAPMHGTIIKVLVTVGDVIESGQTVCVLEAMKMEHSLESPRSGTVKVVHVSAGDYVAAGDEIIVIE